MVPGVGGGELVVIAIVALVVVGPKDLPKLLRELGKFVGKMRRMADEFRQSFDDMARQSELDDLRKEVEALRTGKSVPIIGDVNDQMRAIETDIKTNMRSVPSTPAPEIDPQLADPQLDGLPPKWGEGVAPPAILPEEPEIVIKKPRARKSAPIIDVAPEPTPESVPEPLVEPTVKPRKRAASKKTVS